MMNSNAWLTVTVIVEMMIAGSLAGAVHAPAPAPVHPPALAPHGPAPPPAVEDCSTMEFELLPCVAYIGAGSNDTMPTKDCCKGLAGVLEKNHTCVCVALKDSGDMGITINMTRAAVLAPRCHLRAPPISDCHFSSPPPPPPPAAAPTPRMGPSPKSEPAAPTATPATPAPAPAKSSSSSSRSSSSFSNSIIFMIPLLFAAFLLS
ncbi:hypothetical protein Dimus_027126 [Dionaea muscipula]